MWEAYHQHLPTPTNTRPYLLMFSHTHYYLEAPSNALSYPSTPSSMIQIWWCSLGMLTLYFYRSTFNNYGYFISEMQFFIVILAILVQSCRSFDYPAEGEYRQLYPCISPNGTNECDCPNGYELRRNGSSCDGVFFF